MYELIIFNYIRVNSIDFCVDTHLHIGLMCKAVLDQFAHSIHLNSLRIGKLIVKY